MKYKIWSIEHNSWWAHDHWGYTTELLSAGEYTAKEAKEICRFANEGGAMNECMIPIVSLRVK